MTIYRNRANWILTIFLLICNIDNYSQNCDESFGQVKAGSKLECIQGIHSPINDNNPDSETYLITKGFKTIGLILKKEGGKRSFFELNVAYQGFGNFPEYKGNSGSYSIVDSFYVCDLKQDGPHYISFLEKHVKPNGWVTNLVTQPEYFCDGSFIESSDRHLTMFEPLSYFPYSAYYYLNEQSKKDNRDYLNEFDILNKLKKAKVTVDKTYFHNDPNENTKRKSFVVKGDQVIIDKINEDWVKVAYEGEKVTTEGWLKRLDVEIID